MNVALSSALTSIATTALPLDRGARAAREFESVLLTSLFDSLQKSFRFGQQDTTPGADDYGLMGTRALAEAVAADGGIGIARLILSHLPVTEVPGTKETTGPEKELKFLLPPPI